MMIHTKKWQCAYYGIGIGSSWHGAIMIMVSVTAVTVVKNAMKWKNQVLVRAYMHMPFEVV